MMWDQAVKSGRCRAKSIGVRGRECYVVDYEKSLFKDYVYPVLKTGALYEGSYLLGTSMARPVIAKAQVELALKLGADALAQAQKVR